MDLAQDTELIVYGLRIAEHSFLWDTEMISIVNQFSVRYQ